MAATSPLLALRDTLPPALSRQVVASLSAGEKESATSNLEEAWWSEEPVARDYWDVELSGGGIYRIYRDVENGDWFADGVYD